MEMIEPVRFAKGFCIVKHGVDPSLWQMGARKPFLEDAGGLQSIKAALTDNLEAA